MPDSRRTAASATHTPSPPCEGGARGGEGPHTPVIRWPCKGGARGGEGPHTPVIRRRALSLLRLCVFATSMAALPATEARQPEEPPGPKLVEVLPLVDRVLLLHFDEGHVVHHERGQPRSDEQVVAGPLDTAAATRPASCRISSPDDPAYSRPRSPESVGRKSKGTDFAWFVDRWENGRAVNTRPDHAKEHWLYLELPSPMARGKTYTIDTGSLASNGRTWTLKFDEANVRSEAVHVNLLGYVPAATQKFAYVYHWMGDRGSLDLRPYAGRPFRLFDQATGKPAFTGKLVFRAARSQQETFHESDSPPDGNFLKADVYECDFSSFTRPGKYRVVVEGIGPRSRSALTPTFIAKPSAPSPGGSTTTAAALPWKRPFTEFTPPRAPQPEAHAGVRRQAHLHDQTLYRVGLGRRRGQGLACPLKGADRVGRLVPGRGRLGQLRDAPAGCPGAPPGVSARAAKLPRWRGIPESKNGAPDLFGRGRMVAAVLLSAAARACKGYGTGGIGLRIAGDAFGDDEKTLPDGKKVGQGSWEDVNRTWAASGEDPWSTYRYAGAAAQLAFCLKLARVADPGGIDWTAEAREAFEWARKNTRPGDLDRQPSLKVPRAYASRLFQLGGEKAYRAQFLEDTADITPTFSDLWDERQIWPQLYALAVGKGKPQAAPLERIAPRSCSQPTRLSKWPANGRYVGGNWFMPMLIGHSTKDSDGATARRRACLVAAFRPCACETVPRHARDHLRLLPWLQRRST